MIKITVRLNNDFDTQYKEIIIDKEKLKQIACDKAREDDEVNINVNS